MAANKVVLREFLQLAKEWDGKQLVGGWLMSEKLDGQRALWDGGVTRGRYPSEIPWANVEKDGRRVDGGYRATGLWSRYGHVIAAPDWWLDLLPPGVVLDGELYAGRGGHQRLRKVVAEFVPGDGWSGVDYRWFAKPSPSEVFSDGEIRGTNFRKVISSRECLRFFNTMLGVAPSNNEVCKELEQVKLPPSTLMAEKVIKDRLHDVTEAGGEGLILRCPGIGWTPKRVGWLLKVKKERDSEATVVGWQWGRVTDKGSKLLGMMGALKVKWRNTAGKEVTFYLSGFTDAEREMSNGAEHLVLEGKDVVEGRSVKFKMGDKVTFTYRELTDDGFPKEARYLRKWKAE